MKEAKISAPIVLFVYNRPWHTQQTIEALQRNELAQESELFIYADAPKNSEAQKGVDEVRSYIDTLKGFKKITIVKREKNWGLANSIIDGVTSIVNQYGKIIVLEDDLVTSPYFLRFMNDALDFYENNKKVWHISAWNYPIDKKGLDDVFLWRVMNCWGWATWADRWQYYERDIDKTVAQFSRNDIKKFNVDGVENFWGQVLLNKKGVIHTWAIFWYATIFKHGGLCLNPTQTFVENIGHDGTGEHCSQNESFKSDISYQKTLNLQANIEENIEVLRRIKAFFKAQKKSFFYRVINKISRIFMGRNLLK
jgi:hypothetical protein